MTLNADLVKSLAFTSSRLLPGLIEQSRRGWPGLAPRQRWEATDALADLEALLSNLQKGA